ncbi:hypothetical protein K4F52_010161 [Lecanicillium sp. MT-2017a]|nr:hypothetical protein K4F52_010161 [Lecanicillium sp. MT-2017a]
MCGFVAVCTHSGNTDSPRRAPTSVAANELPEGKAKSEILIPKCSELTEQLERSLELIKHRGPDGSEVWVSADATVGLGHCRLAINDTSPSGTQPMHSADGKIHAVVIGEIYDYDKLRNQCEDLGYRFLGGSDSELVLALYKLHGAPGFFRLLRGEFSFVIVDERAQTKKIIAARDRFGIKPLFWTTQRNRILFAAEAKAFLGLGWTPEWDVESIATSGWLADERTMFKGVRKLAPGHWMEITPESAGSELETRQYWDQQYPIKASRDHPKKLTGDAITTMIEEVRERLVDAVRVRLCADVPMGLYLSGGIDSSAVAGIVAHLVSRENMKFGSLGKDTGDPFKIKCFTVRYTDTTYDESEVATRTVEWLSKKYGLQVECHKLDMDEQKLADNFEDSVYHTEHHIFDLNTTAKSALSGLPKEHGIKAVLSGEGSDEHFAGYSYFTADFLRDADHSMGDSALVQDTFRQALQSRVISEMKEIVKPQGLDMCCDAEDGASDLKRGMTLPAVLSLFPQGKIFADWVLAGHNFVPAPALSLFFAAKDKIKTWHSLHKSLYVWVKTLLPNTILTGLGDRSEMRNSIEGRPPFLDHHLAELVNSLPPSVKMRYSPEQGQGLTKDNAGDYWWKGSGSGLQSVTEKWILREAVRPFISEEMYRRRKLMFLAPIRWAKNGPLHLMFQRVLTQESVEELGFVNWPFVQDALERGFGEAADGACFRAVIYAASWVTICNRFKQVRRQLRAAIET